MLLLALLPLKHFLAFPLGFHSLGGRREDEQAALKAWEDTKKEVAEILCKIAKFGIRPAFYDIVERSTVRYQYRTEAN